MGLIGDIKEFINFKKNRNVPAPDGEIGRQTVIWTELGGESFNPSDIDIKTYKEMLKDAQIKAGFSLIKFAALSREWELIWPKDSTKATIKERKEINEFIQSNFENMDEGLEGALSTVLTSIVFGFSVTEKVFDVIPDGKFKNLIALKRLKGLDPETIEFVVDSFGNLEKVLQSTSTDDEKIALNISNLIIYNTDAEFGNIYGVSRLRAVYKNWFIKDILIKFWNIALERFGIPILVGTVPTSQDFQKMQGILDGLKFKSSITKNPGWEIEALETGIGRSSGGDFATAIKYHDEQILTGLLIPPTVLTSAEGGSFALSKTQFSVFQLMLKQVARDIEQIVEKKIVRPLLKLNFSTQIFPKFKFKPMTKEDLLELSKAFALLVKNGMVLPEEELLRDMLGMQRLDKEEKSKLEKRNEKALEKTKSSGPNVKSQQVKTPRARSPR